MTSKRLLITGSKGFTGQHLSREAEAYGYTCCFLDGDITDASLVASHVQQIQPTHVIHLAAISAVTHHDPLDFYRVNLLGTQNLLEALQNLPNPVQRVLLASSANVYGHVECNAISEGLTPKPVNHYAISKLAMELMAATFAGKLPIILVRPFNYTGVGHDDRFVIPKIIDHFARKAPLIELGNITVEREYNDVRTVCEAYLRLLEKGVVGEIYNICSGRALTIQQVIATLEALSGHRVQVQVNPDFVRANEIQRVAGDPTKLVQRIGQLEWPTLEETLGWMLAKTQR